MSYIVFARKWRPQNFNEVIGQEHITTTLENAIKQDRVAHAYLFCGPRGIGKTTTARILSKALNCEKGPTPSPCNKCTSCKEITLGSSLDIIEIDGASNRGIDEIRNIKENVKFAPQQGRFKIYIIDEVHMLTNEAFNALLKTLEEPPQHVKFIFATTAAHKVIPTILSRCQRFNFRRLLSQDIIIKLKEIAKREKIKIEEKALYAIIRAASGSMRDAESLIDQLATYCKNNIAIKDVNNVLGLIGEDALYEFCRHIIKKDTASAIKLINKIVDDGADPAQFLESLIEFFRSVMVIKEGKDPSKLIDLPSSEIEAISKESESLTTEDVLYIIYSLINTNNSIRRASSQKIPLELLAVKLTQKESIVSLAEIMNRLSLLEKGQGSRSQEPIAQTSPKPLIKSNESTKEKNEIPNNDIDKAEDIEEVEPGLEADPALYRIREVMPKVIRNIRQEKIYIASCLSEGKLVSFKEDVLKLGFLKNNTFHKESLEKTENKKMIEDHFSKVLGSNTRIEFVIVSGSSESEENKNPEETDKVERSPLKKALADPIIKTAIDMFDGNIMKLM